jgi:hypothetical protein
MMGGSHALLIPSWSLEGMDRVINHTLHSPNTCHYFFLPFQLQSKQTISRTLRLPVVPQALPIRPATSVPRLPAFVLSNSDPDYFIYWNFVDATAIFLLQHIFGDKNAHTSTKPAQEPNAAHAREVYPAAVEVPRAAYRVHVPESVPKYINR